MDDEDEDWSVDPPLIEVEIEDPIVLGELFGPDGQVIATLYDRRPIPFGFQPQETPQ